MSGNRAFNYKRKVHQTVCDRLLNFMNLSYLVSVIAIGFQSWVLNFVFFYYYITEDGVIALFLVEGCQLLYMLHNYSAEKAAKMGAVIWISYSWLMAGKFVVLYLKVLPHVDAIAGTTADAYAWLRTPASLSVSLYLVSVVYIALMFRAQKALFGHFHGMPTPDIIMHQDMVWHVALDIVDVVNMVKYSRLQDFLDVDIVLENWEALNVFRRLSPLFIFLSLLAHAQSFPGAEWKFQWSVLPVETVQAVHEAVLGKEALQRAAEKRLAAEQEEEELRRSSSFREPDQHMELFSTTSPDTTTLFTADDNVGSGEVTPEQQGGTRGIRSSNTAAGAGTTSVPVDPRRTSARLSASSGTAGTSAVDDPRFTEISRATTLRTSMGSRSSSRTVGGADEEHVEERDPVVVDPQDVVVTVEQELPEDVDVNPVLADESDLPLPRGTATATSSAAGARSTTTTSTSRGNYNAAPRTPSKVEGPKRALLDELFERQEMAGLVREEGSGKQLTSYRGGSSSSSAIVNMDEVRVTTDDNVENDNQAPATTTSRRNKKKKKSKVKKLYEQMAENFQQETTRRATATDADLDRQSVSDRSHGFSTFSKAGEGLIASTRSAHEHPLATTAVTGSIAHTSFLLRTQLDVTCARERSAKISLFLVDLPFGLLRMYLFLITLQSPTPLWPPLAMKNIACFFLQGLQLRMVEQRKAELYAVLAEFDEPAEEYKIHRAKLWLQESAKFFEDYTTTAWTLRNMAIGMVFYLPTKVLFTLFGRNTILHRSAVRMLQKLGLIDEPDQAATSSVTTLQKDHPESREHSGTTPSRVGKITGDGRSSASGGTARGGEVPGGAVVLDGTYARPSAARAIPPPNDTSTNDLGEPVVLLDEAIVKFSPEEFQVDSGSTARIDASDRQMPERQQQDEQTPSQSDASLSAGSSPSPSTRARPRVKFRSPSGGSLSDTATSPRKRKHRKLRTGSSGREDKDNELFRDDGAAYAEDHDSEFLSSAGGGGSQTSEILSDTSLTTSKQTSEDFTSYYHEDDDASSVLSSRLEVELTSRRDQQRELLLFSVLGQTDVTVKLRRNSGFPNFCLVFMIGFFLGALLAFQETIGTIIRGESVSETFKGVDVTVLWGGRG
ncbi:unnamed protein product [Amoebophrya sp. A120]|nr:unnamed protein product [Amoebophrya sp. A120]|eukprot:GSA120T00017621001.1